MIIQRTYIYVYYMSILYIPIQYTFLCDEYIIPIYVMNLFFRNGSRVRLSPWATPKALQITRAPVHAHEEAYPAQAAPVGTHEEEGPLSPCPGRSSRRPQRGRPCPGRPCRRQRGIYICVRCKYFSKDTNIEMKKKQTRQKMSKLVLSRHLSM